MKNIAVFCGSNFGASPDFLRIANEVGTFLGTNGLTLIYGGAKVGLMGAVADSALIAGGRVVGVTPEALIAKEVAHLGLTELIVVPDMHARKQKMFDLADGFICLPGGPGTLDEMFEIYTWLQLQLHSKPLAVLNINGFYNTLMIFLGQLVEAKFMKQAHLEMLIVEQQFPPLWERLNNFIPPKVDKWFS